MTSTQRRTCRETPRLFRCPLQARGCWRALVRPFFAGASRRKPELAAAINMKPMLASALPAECLIAGRSCRRSERRGRLREFPIQAGRAWRRKPGAGAFMKSRGRPFSPAPRKEAARSQLSPRWRSPSPAAGRRLLRVADAWNRGAVTLRREFLAPRPSSCSRGASRGSSRHRGPTA